MCAVRQDDGCGSHPFERRGLPGEGTEDLSLRQGRHAVAQQDGEKELVGPLVHDLVQALPERLQLREDSVLSLTLCHPDLLLSAVT